MSTVNAQIIEENISSTVSVAVVAQKELYTHKIKSDQKDTESQDSDKDYNPIEDEQQIIADEQEDYDSQDSTEEEQSDSDGSYELDDTKLCDIFQTELENAKAYVQKIAKQDQTKILSIATEAYIKSTGQQPSDEIISEALKAIESESESVESGVSEEEIEIDPNVFESEFAEALQIVRELGKKHQEIFVNNLCNTFAEVNGKEPSTNDLSAIFSRIKQKFGEEAREEFISENEASDCDTESEGSEDSDSDSDFKPTESDDEIVETDKVIDAEEEDEVNELDENYEAEKDSEDYSQDIEDDFAESSESELEIESVSGNEEDTVNID